MPTKTRSLIHKMLTAGSVADLNEQLEIAMKENPELRIPLKEIVGTAARYKVDLRRKFGIELELIYLRFLKKCLADGLLSENEKHSLERLKIILGLSDRTVSKLHARAVMSVYRKTVEEVLSDRSFNTKQRAFLKSLQHELKLPDRLAEKIFRDEAAELIRRSMIQALSDERLSPAEDKEIHALARSLGATIEVDGKTKAMLDKYRLYWLIENGKIPRIKAGIRLNKGENCFFVADVLWCELSNAQKSARFAGLPDEAEHLESAGTPEVLPVDSGKIFLTDRRLIFHGEKGSIAIALSQIVDFVLVEGGVHIHRKRGENPFIKLELGADVFTLMLSRLLQDLHR